MEKKKIQQKELLFFHKSLLEAAETLERDIEADPQLSSEEKEALKQLVSEKGGLEEARHEVRLEKLRSLPSFKAFQVFLQSEKIAQIDSGAAADGVVEIESKIGEIGGRG